MERSVFPDSLDWTKAPHLLALNLSAKEYGTDLESRRRPLGNRPSRAPKKTVKERLGALKVEKTQILPKCGDTKRVTRDQKHAEQPVRK